MQKRDATVSPLLTDLYQSGAIPKAWINFTTEDVTTFMQQGRAAMSIDPIDRTVAYNDPKASKFPGKLQVTNLPAAKEFGDAKYAEAACAW